MTKENNVDVEEVEEEKVVVAERFCKGNMPMALVWFIKFHEDQDNKSAIAKKYFTTSGKISDIQSGSNQKYIVENMKWTETELAEMGATVSANFVRGQDDKIIMANPDANKRKLATTTLEDSEYSLSVLEEINAMTFEDDAVTLSEARAAYNTEHPRTTKPKAKDEALGETTEDQTEEAVTESDEDLVEDLLD